MHTLIQLIQFDTINSVAFIYINKYNMAALTLTLTLTLNKVYFDINEKDKQQEIDNMIYRDINKYTLC